MTEIMPFPENNILFYWAAPQRGAFLLCRCWTRTHLNATYRWYVARHRLDGDDTIRFRTAETAIESGHLPPPQRGAFLLCRRWTRTHLNATGCVLRRIVYPQKGALTHHWKTSSVVRSLQLTSYNLQLVYSSSWTIAVFTCVALTGIFCIKTT